MLCRAGNVNDLVISRYPSDLAATNLSMLDSLLED
jgi:hypothetical protein